MQPWFETVSIPADRSWLLFDRQLPEFPFNWHYHPEFELTLTVNSRGMRVVGDHVEQYGDGDLVLLGPDLPHAWQSRELLGPGLHRAIVCWFTRDWAEALLALIPEFSPVGTLLAESGRGLVFDRDTVAQLRPKMLALGTLPAARQALQLQMFLLDLAGAARRPLSSGQVAVSGMPRDQARMRRVLDWLHAHYDQPLRLAPLCARAHLTASQLQRVFKRSTGMSISRYVLHLRIGRACQMLAQTDLPLTRIAVDCGFSDAAHFSRQFRAVRGMPPSRFRSGFRGINDPADAQGKAHRENK